jgi:uncharacterized protein (TIGR01568 family)
MTLTTQTRRWTLQPSSPPNAFFSSPGRSNSIFESPDTKQEDPDNTLVITGSVKVPKYSLDPYIDFQCSMQEMVEARNPMDVTSEWEYLNELLLCYLTLNPKHTHKYIVRAFSDLVICILSASPSSSGAQLKINVLIFSFFFLGAPWLIFNGKNKGASADKRKKRTMIKT